MGYNMLEPFDPFDPSHGMYQLMSCIHGVRVTEDCNICQWDEPAGEE